MNLLWILSGSIACYKACDAISQLVQRGHRIRTVTTESALRFVGTSTLEGLTREPVATDVFTPGAALDHIELARWADAVVVAPASANLLNRLAAGLADDLATTLLLAHDWKKPLLVAPAMNPAMWQHPATARSVRRLRSWGARFIAPGAGRTACGEVGEGRLAEPAEIAAAVEAALARPARCLRLLITSGGTAEPIDSVRVLTNTSSGRTGALLAGYFARRGHEVTLLRAASSSSVDTPVHAEETYTTFADLDAALTRQLGAQDFDVVIHAAAVSDYAVDALLVDGAPVTPGTGKIDSGAAPVIRLRRNPKLLDTLRTRSRNPAVRIVAFKLTSGADAAAAHHAINAIFARGVADYVVYNDLATRTARAFPAEIWRAGEPGPMPCADRPALAENLETLLTI